VLEIKPAHAGHVNVGDDAVAPAFPVRRGKFIRGHKSTEAVPQRAERLNQRRPEWFVFVQ